MPSILQKMAKAARYMGLRMSLTLMPAIYKTFCAAHDEFRQSFAYRFRKMLTYSIYWLHRRWENPKSCLATLNFL